MQINWCSWLSLSPLGLQASSIVSSGQSCYSFYCIPIFKSCLPTLCSETIPEKNPKTISTGEPREGNSYPQSDWALSQQSSFTRKRPTSPPKALTNACFFSAYIHGCICRNGCLFGKGHCLSTLGWSPFMFPRLEKSTHASNCVQMFLGGIYGKKLKLLNWTHDFQALPPSLKVGKIQPRLWLGLWSVLIPTDN